MAKTTAEMVKVMQAYLDDADIEECDKALPVWITPKSVTWNWDRFDYRVKPEPREWWTCDV